jgi:prepilin-type N-terminal cleavage/methylation domain-containing protein
MSPRRPSGFTLVEVLVAVVVTGLIALLAHQLFAAAVDGANRLAGARRQLDRQSNARDFLRDAFLALDVADGAHAFDGDPARLTFSTWLPVSDGWNERRTVVLGLEGPRLTAEVDGLAPLVLADSVAALSLDYLLTPGAEARWAMQWHSPVSAPLAVRVRVTRAAGACDTVLYLVKARG